MIKEEVVQIRLNPANIRHYSKHGYSGENGETIDVLTTHLTKSSATKITRICDVCGEAKLVSRKKYFSVCQVCVVKSRAIPDELKSGYSPCVDCGVFIKNATRCKSCHSKFAIGKNNPNFGNGDKIRGSNNPNFGKRGEECEWYNHSITNEERNSKRQSLDCINWRKAVYARFNYTCDCCGMYLSGGSCVAHHLEGWSLNKELRQVVSNGVCLCKTCHLEFHKQYGFGDNTTEQYLEFKEAVYASN